MSSYDKKVREVINQSKSSLSMDVEMKNSTIKFLKNSNESLEIQLNKAKTEIKSLGAKVKQLESQAEEHTSYRIKLEGELASAKKKIEQLEAGLTESDYFPMQEPTTPASADKKILKRSSINNKDEHESSSEDSNDKEEWTMIKNKKETRQATSSSSSTPSSGKKRGRPSKIASKRSGNSSGENKHKKAKKQKNEESENESDEEHSSESEEVPDTSKNNTPNKDFVPSPFEGFTRASNRKAAVTTPAAPVKKQQKKTTESVSSASSVSAEKADKFPTAGVSSASAAVHSISSGTESAGTLVGQCRELCHATNEDTLLRLVNKLLQRFIKGTPSIQVMLQEKVDMKLCSLFNVDDNEELLHRAMIVFNNLIARTTPEQFKVAVDRNKIIPTLVQLITHTKEGVQEQAMWILDNIAIDGDTYRRKAVEAGILTPVLKCLNKTKNKSVALIGSKLIATLTTGGFYKLPQDQTAIAGIVAYLGRVIPAYEQQSAEVLCNCCNALFSLTQEEDEDIIQMVLQNVSMVKALITCLGQNNTNVKLQAINALANLAASKASGNPDDLLILLQYGIVDMLKQLLRNEGTTILVGVCRCIANITAGNDADLQAVIEADLMPIMITHATTSKNEYLTLYASYAVVYAFFGANLLQTQYLVDQEAVRVVIRVLAKGEPRLVLEALKCLKVLGEKFDYMSDFEYVSELIEEDDGWKVIAKCGRDYGKLAEKETNNEDKDLYNKIRRMAEKMTKQYFVDFYSKLEENRAVAPTDDV